MTHYINGHMVEFYANGRIAVDGQVIALAINAANGGHYTAISPDKLAISNVGFEAMSGRKLTGPRRPIGSYEQNLAAEIVAVMYPVSE